MKQKIKKLLLGLIIIDWIRVCIVGPCILLFNDSHKDEDGNLSINERFHKASSEAVELFKTKNRLHK